MTIYCRVSSVALVALAVCAVPAQQPKQSAGSQKIESTPAKKERLYPLGVFAGKVLDVDDDGQSFLMQVHGKTAELQFIPGNPGSC